MPHAIPWLIVEWFEGGFCGIVCNPDLHLFCSVSKPGIEPALTWFMSVEDCVSVCFIQNFTQEENRPKPTEGVDWRNEMKTKNKKKTVSVSTFCLQLSCASVLFVVDDELTWVQWSRQIQKENYVGWWRSIRSVGFLSRMLDKSQAGTTEELLLGWCGIGDHNEDLFTAALVFLFIFYHEFASCVVAMPADW